MAATKKTRKPAAKATSAAKKSATVTTKPHGRPQSALDLPAGWEKRIVDEYRDGASDAEIKAMIYEMRGSFSNDLFERWMRDEPRFSEAITHGRMLAEAWWTRTGRQNLATQGFIPRLWEINMRNRFGWREKIEHAGADGGPLAVTVTVVGERDAKR
jgi:hypothetical protein